MIDIYEEVMKHEGFYSLMYAPYRTDSFSLEQQIIYIKKEEIEWAKDNKSFIFIWGWPGPDFNTYKAEDYGKSWAFTKEEILNAWR